MDPAFQQSADIGGSTMAMAMPVQTAVPQAFVQALPQTCIVPTPPAPPPRGNMQVGTVKAWFEDQGFGLLVVEGMPDDILVERKALTDGRSLQQGATVMFAAAYDSSHGKYVASNCSGAVPSPAGPLLGAMPGLGTMQGPTMPGPAMPGISAVPCQTMSCPTMPSPAMLGQGFGCWAGNGGSSVSMDGANGFSCWGRMNATPSDGTGMGTNVAQHLLGGGCAFGGGGNWEGACAIGSGGWGSCGGCSNCGYNPGCWGIATGAMGTLDGSGCGYKSMNNDQCFGNWGGMSSTSNGGYQSGIGGSNPEPSDNLFVAGLPHDITESALREIFSKWGMVGQCKFLQPNGIRPDRAALVRMGTVEQATWIVNYINGTIPTGLSAPLTVRYADLPQPPVSDNLFVAGLPLDVSEERVREIFSTFGTVNRCRVLPPIPDKYDRTCLVQMGSPEQATWVIDNVNMTCPNGLTTPLLIRFADNRNRGKGREEGSDNQSYGKAMVAQTDNRSSPYGHQGSGGCGQQQLYVQQGSGGCGQQQLSQLPLAFGGCGSCGGCGGTTASGQDTKIFVGSIPLGTTQAKLREVFSNFGLVMDVVLREDNRQGGRMWAFVTFADAAAVTRSLAAHVLLPGSVFPLQVSPARGLQTGMGPNPLRVKFARPSNSSDGGETAGKLFIGNIPAGTPPEVIKAEFEKFGAVTTLFMKEDRNGSGRLWGFVTFLDPNAAAKAVAAMDNQIILPPTMGIQFQSKLQQGCSAPTYGEDIVGAAVNSVPSLGKEDIANAAIPTAPSLGKEDITDSAVTTVPNSGKADMLPMGFDAQTVEALGIDPASAAALGTLAALAAESEGAAGAAT